MSVEMWLIPVVLALLTAAGNDVCSAETEAWRLEREGKRFFHFSRGERFQPSTGGYVRTLEFSAPAKTPSTAPVRLRVCRSVPLRPGEPAELVIGYRDGYVAASNRGYYRAFVRAGERSLWEGDAADANDREFRVTVPPEMMAAGILPLSVGLEGVRPVKNFRLKAVFEKLEIRQGGETRSLLESIAPVADFREIADTAPVALLPPRNPEWMWNLVAVQGWFQPDFNLLKRRDVYLPLVRDELKMNVIIMRPPAVFNAKHHNRQAPPGHAHTPPEDFFITDEEFFSAMADYRKAGFKIVLYTSITNLGHTKEWNTGKIQDEHPDWLQRGPNGEAVYAFGNRNLCPNTGALDAAIAYSRELVEKYKVDALMFDNNFFQIPRSADGGGIAACYCASCRDKFRAYMRKHYATDLEPVFGVTAETVDIPTEPGALWNVWLDWRNRVWAEAMNKVRAAIDVPVWANTEYMWADWQLGVDRVYRGEDAVFSESNALGDLAEKYCLGNAYAPDRPHFSYLVPYTVGGERFWRLRPPAEVAELMGTTLAFNVRPWLMFHGWDPELGYPEPVGDANRESQEVLKRYFRFRYAYRDWFRTMTPVAEIGVVTSSRNRMYRSGRNFSPGLAAMLRNGFAAEAVHDLTLAETDLTRYRFLLADEYECMSEAEAEKLIEFVKKGGIIWVTADVGRRDQFGRIRPESALLSRWERVRENAAGNIELFDHVNGLAETIGDRMRWKSKAYLAVIRPYRLPDGRVLLHGVARRGRHQRRDLHLPEALRGAGTVKLHSPHFEAPRRLTVRDGVVSIPEEAWYFIVEAAAPVPERR